LFCFSQQLVACKAWDLVSSFSEEAQVPFTKSNLMVMVKTDFDELEPERKFQVCCQLMATN